MVLLINEGPDALSSAAELLGCGIVGWHSDTGERVPSGSIRPYNLVLWWKR
jgi:hypothetical protein